MKRLVLLLLVVFLVSAAQAVVVGSDADTYLRDGRIAGDYEYMDIRGAYAFTGYVRFDLSSVSYTTLEGAQLVLTVSGGASRNDTLVTGRFALAGLNDVAGNTPQDWDESTLDTLTVGAEWGGTHPLDTSSGRLTNLDMEGVAGITETLNPGASADPGTTMTVTGTALEAFLQSRIDDTGLVTFLIAFPDASDRGYGLATKENATAEWHPALILVPEPATMLLLGLGSLVAVRRKR